MLQKSSMQVVFEEFLVNPTAKMYLMSISRKTSIAHTSVKESIGKLMRKKLVRKSVEKRGLRSFPLYEANRDNKTFIHLKQLYNLAAMLESGIVEYIRDICAPRAIVVFGSYKRGEDIENSDIDIFIESDEKRLSLHTYEKKLHRKIQPHFNKNFQSYSTELKNNIINGFVIYGFLEGYA